MSELLTMWMQWLPELWKGFVLSMQVTAVSLGLGVVLGLLLALGVSSPSRWLRYPSLVVVELGRGAPALIDPAAVFLLWPAQRQPHPDLVLGCCAGHGVLHGRLHQ